MYTIVWPHPEASKMTVEARTFVKMFYWEGQDRINKVAKISPSSLLSHLYPSYLEEIIQDWTYRLWENTNEEKYTKLFQRDDRWRRLGLEGGVGEFPSLVLFTDSPPPFQRKTPYTTGSQLAVGFVVNGVSLCAFVCVWVCVHVCNYVFVHDCLCKHLHPLSCYLPCFL